MKPMDIISRYSTRPMTTVMGLIGWSLLMMLLGSLAGTRVVESGANILGISQSHAMSEKSAEIQITRLDRERLSGNNLGEFTAYEPESGDLVARGHEYFYSSDGSFGIGVWESKPGKMTYTDLEYDELMFVLDGSLVLTNEQGKIETFTQGEGLVLPRGWTGTLAVGEGGVRKIWVSYMDMDGKQG
jgi:uncharacterized cupin superfamily protein